MGGTCIAKYTKLILTFILLSIYIQATAQVSTSLDVVKKEFPGELAVYLKKSDHLTIDIIHDSVIVNSDNYAEMLYLSDKASIYAEKSIYQSKFVEVSNIEAKTLSPTKKDKFETIKVAHFQTQSDLDGSIFFDDSKKTTFVFPGIKEGAKTILQYKETFREPRFINTYFFSEHVGVVESELKVTFPTKVKIHYQTFGIDNNQLEFTSVTKGNKTTYSWKARDLKGYRIERSSPDIRYYAPHIMVYVDEAEIKGKKQEFLANPAQLYSFFHGFVKNVNTQEDPQIKKVVDSLTTGAKTDIEKTRRIFYWVQDNIRYIAFEDAYGGFIPREASAVFQKKYGDCKDMASIITAMLKCANIPSSLTWIGSRSIPYTFDKNPAPSSCNHMIATAKINGEYIYLDATGIYTRFGFPTAMIQGKECIMGISETTFDKQFVPILTPDKNARYDSVSISLKNKTVIGSGKAVIDGYSKLDLVHAIISTKKEKEQEILVSYLEKGNNKFFLQKYEMNNVNDRDKALEITYDFKIEDYDKTINDEIYINLNLEKTFHSSDVEATRQLAVQYSYKYTDDLVVVLDVPAGYKINYVPENAAYKNDLFGFKLDYSVKNNKIKLKRKITFNTLMIEKKSFEEWNKMIDELNKAYKEVVVLKK